MCVTFGPAEITGTRAYTVASQDGPRPLHITGYQNEATSLSETPNCMLLHYPGDNIQQVDGPQRTWHLMESLTAGLPSIEPIFLGRSRARNASSSGASGSARVVEYGAYHLVLAEECSDILPAIMHVPDERRPRVTNQLEELIAWYAQHFTAHSFVLACFAGSVKPTHPIVVQYHPHSDDVLTVPGVDGHTGQTPVLDETMPRDFRVAFAVDGMTLQIPVSYRDSILKDTVWAPTTVTGFYDNRSAGPNNDYVVPLQAVEMGFAGRELLAA